MNAVNKEDGTELIHLVKDVKTQWSIISLSAQKNSALRGVHGNCKVCKTESRRCEELKDCVQELMNQGVLQFSREKTMGEIPVIEPIEIFIVRNKLKIR